MIPYGRQDISDQDVEAVVEVLRSDYLTQGQMVPRFEEAMCAYTGAEYAVAANSATSALHIACIALEVGQGDVVWTSPITFVASANCALYCGASVDFIDINPVTRNIDIDLLEDRLSYAQRMNKPLPKVLIVVHMAGIPCDMQSIQKLSQHYGFRVIEDASHALGARYHGAPIGKTSYSDIAIFSFHPVKIITSGEGGMALTDSPELANRLRKLRSHGITRDSVEMQHRENGLWYYQQIDLGFNYRMTDIHAALGVSQLKRADEFVARRNILADSYDKQLRGLPLGLPVRNESDYAAMHLYVIRLKTSEVSLSQEEAFEWMRERGVSVNLHYIPVYLQPYYEALGFREGYCPEAEKYYHEAMTLPLFPRLKDEEQELVVALLNEMLQA